MVANILSTLTYLIIIALQYSIHSNKIPHNKKKVSEGLKHLTCNMTLRRCRLKQWSKKHSSVVIDTKDELGLIISIVWNPLASFQIHEGT